VPVIDRVSACHTHSVPVIDRVIIQTASLSYTELSIAHSVPFIHRVIAVIHRVINCAELSMMHSEPAINSIFATRFGGQIKNK
jgi:hypothetical protein